MKGEHMTRIVAALLRRLHTDQRGLNTAELLGNAALAIVALIAIWAALRQAGVDIVAWITQTLLSEDLS
jgi:hypothetical protein